MYSSVGLANIETMTDNVINSTENIGLSQKLDEYLNNSKLKMDNNNVIQLIGAVLVGILGTLGIPKIWAPWFGHLSKKHSMSMKCKEEINQLKNKNTQIVTAVNMLLIIIQHKYKDDPGIEEAIKKVKEHLEENKN